MAILYQLLLSVSLLLTNAMASGNQVQMQQALLTAQQTVSIVQESGVLNPVTPVYQNQTSTPLDVVTTPSPVLKSVSATPEVWTCKLIYPPSGWGMVDQNGIINTSTLTYPTGFTVQRLQAMGRTPCNWQ